jgi:hypothetical protein
LASERFYNDARLFSVLGIIFTWINSDADVACLGNVITWIYSTADVAILGNPCFSRSELNSPHLAFSFFDLLFLLAGKLFESCHARWQCRFLDD